MGDPADAETADEKRLMRLVESFKWAVFTCGMDLSKADAKGRAILAHYRRQLRRVAKSAREDAQHEARSRTRRRRR